MIMDSKKFFSAAQKHLMTATGYMIPFVVAGGVIFAISVMLNGKAAQPTTGWLGQLNMIGSAGLTLFIPALGGYIAYSMADRPGLAPGFITAYLATEIKAGFIGGIIGGVLAGFVVMQLKKIKFSPSYKTLGSIFLYPLGGTLIAGGVMVYLIGEPIASFMTWLTAMLNGMSGVAKAPLGALLGSMIGFDMGGPINKVAATFAQTQVNTLPYLMGGVGSAICVPPIGLGVATLIFKKKFSPAERDSGKAALLMGFCGITEGAIPFATSDPLHVIPANTIGAAVSCVISFMLGCLNHAPWGGLITLPVVENRLGYILAVVVGSLVTASIVGLTKKAYVDGSKFKTEDDEDLDFDIKQF
ncbi:PTS fructose transporter subunit EIIC [Lactiplantibacillus pentosus]|jgi:fructose-specific PTS system IIC-like component|nr:PTS fructose transporter subunit EIIC [Lactiplantibacillus pentosus]UXI97265.1 PTS fructose transporter subunit EIIC [Lactiplantibacillus pentosus]BBM21874.1 PTS fructose transporter subunit IIC [Lactiplantibacillus plantarum]